VFVRSPFISNVLVPKIDCRNKSLTNLPLKCECKANRTNSAALSSLKVELWFFVICIQHYMNNFVFLLCYKLEWLGFVWDLKIGSVEIPDRKMAHFKEKLNYVLKNPDRVIARKLASIIGQIISMSFVLGFQFITWFPNAFFLILYKTCKF
jgi:hypothetical protein